MIASLILYILLVSLLLAVAARAIEELLRVIGLPVRYLWLVILLATLSLAIAAPFRAPTDLPDSVGQVEPNPTEAIEENADVAEFQYQLLQVYSTLRQYVEWPFRTFDTLIGNRSEHLVTIIWPALSLILLSLFVTTLYRYHTLRKKWPLRVIAGKEVRVAPDDGPAVMGFMRPEIVVPEWLVKSPPEEQRLVIVHEFEHVRVFDQVVLGIGYLVVVLIPWNPVVWLMLLRLRLGVELDCDKRVLSRGIRPFTYGSILLSVAGRPPSLVRGIPSFAGTPSNLEKRLLAMSVQFTRIALVRATVLTVIGITLLVTACDTHMITGAGTVDELESVGVNEPLGKYEILMVIDGIIAQDGDMEKLQPSQIKSMEILKGEAAIRKYDDPQASQGVVQITTRTGAQLTDPE